MGAGPTFKMKLKPPQAALPAEPTAGQEQAGDPFCLGRSPKRLTAAGLTQLLARWRACAPLDAYTRLNYEANVRVRWNLHTNVLEGSRVTYADAAQIVVHGQSVAGYTLAEVAEVAGHNQALGHMERHAATGAALTVADLWNWHRLLIGPDPPPLRDEAGNLYPVVPGSWKSGRNVIGIAPGRVRHTAAPADVPRLMDEFLNRLHDDLAQVSAGRRDLLDVLADTHSRFVEIHPFDDGNGRTGRLITSWQCLRAHILPIIIPGSAVDIYRMAMNHAAAQRLRPLRNLLAACLVGELEFYIAVSEQRADPTIANREADPQRPPPPRGAGINGG